MRTSLGMILGCLVLGGCATSFYKAVTPSGTPCSDMPVFPAGQAVSRPYHRLRPVASGAKPSTEAERLESLRMEACSIGADGIIEAANEETRGMNGSYITRASGTGVVWLRGANTGASALPSSQSILPSTTTAPVETNPALPTAADEAAQPGASPGAASTSEDEAPAPPPRKKRR